MFLSYKHCDRPLVSVSIGIVWAASIQGKLTFWYRSVRDIAIVAYVTSRVRCVMRGGFYLWEISAFVDAGFSLLDSTLEETNTMSEAKIRCIQVKQPVRQHV